jgi:hypothetical protein
VAGRFPWRSYLLVLAGIGVFALLLAWSTPPVLSLPLGGGAMLVWVVMLLIHWLAWRRQLPSKDNAR